MTWLPSNCTAHIAQFSRRKDNQTMKFGQLTEYNFRNIFEKSYTKYAAETIPRPLSKIPN